MRRGKRVGYRHSPHAKVNYEHRSARKHLGKEQLLHLREQGYKRIYNLSKQKSDLQFRAQFSIRTRPSPAERFAYVFAFGESKHMCSSVNVTTHIYALIHTLYRPTLIRLIV